MGLFTTLIYNLINDEPEFVQVQKQRIAFIKEKIVDKVEDDDFDPAAFKSTHSVANRTDDASRKLKRVKEFVYKKPSKSQESSSFKWFRSNFVRTLPKNRPNKETLLPALPTVQYPRSEDPSSWPVPLDKAHMPRGSNTEVLASGLEEAFGDLEDNRFL